MITGPPPSEIYPCILGKSFFLFGGTLFHSNGFLCMDRGIELEANLRHRLMQLFRKMDPLQLDVYSPPAFIVETVKSKGLHWTTVSDKLELWLAPLDDRKYNGIFLLDSIPKEDLEETVKLNVKAWLQDFQLQAADCGVLENTAVVYFASRAAPNESSGGAP